MLRATSFAALKHREQRRKNASQAPYVEHPIRVAEILATIGKVDAVVVLQAALLHDTIEDTETSFEEIEQQFGPKVAKIVSEVTDHKSLSKIERKQKQIEHASHISSEAKLVKLADKIANLEDLLTKPQGEGIPTDWSVQRVQNYVAWACKVARGLRGVNTGLEQRFDSLVNSNFQYTNGQLYPALPAGDIDRAELI